MNFDDFLKTYNVDIMSFIIALYTIVPPLVVSLMYDFIATITERVDALFNRANQGQLLEKLYQVERFAIISSKYFHLTFSFYLITLTFLLLGFIIDLFLNRFFYFAKKLSQISVIIFIIYSCLYIQRDVFKALSKVNERKIMKGLIFFFAMFVVIPFILLLLLCCMEDLNNFNLKRFGYVLLLVFIETLYIMIWWIFIPSFYKPLTNISYIVRKMRKEA